VGEIRRHASTLVELRFTAAESLRAHPAALQVRGLTFGDGLENWFGCRSRLWRFGPHNLQVGITQIVSDHPDVVQGQIPLH